MKAASSSCPPRNRSTCLDVGRLSCGSSPPRFFVCVASYGYLGDVMASSEQLRFLGPTRYNVSGALQLAGLKRYAATVRYRPAPQAAAATPAAGGGAQAPPCAAGCSVCLAAGLASNAAAGDAFCRATATRTPLSASAGAAAAPGSGAAPGEAGQRRERADAAAAVTVGCGVGAEAYQGQWRTVEGEFASIQVLVTPCRSDMSPAGMYPGAAARQRGCIFRVEGCFVSGIARDCMHVLYVLERHSPELLFTAFVLKLVVMPVYDIASRP